MENKQKKSNYLVLVLITTPKLADKASELFKKEHIAMIYRFNAQGTASSEIMDMLGLGSVDKGVLVSMIPKQISTIVMKKLKKGFTIIELVIVIAVIGILATVLVPTFSTVIKISISERFSINLGIVL